MVTLDTTQKFTIELTAVTDSGAPGTLDSTPTFPVDVPGVVTILPSADGLSCEVRGNAAGTCTITPTAQAGGKTITGPAIDITCTAPPPQPATKLVETISQVVPQ